jgi:hypothetical protein
LNVKGRTQVRPFSISARRKWPKFDFVEATA